MISVIFFYSIIILGFYFIANFSYNKDTNKKKIYIKGLLCLLLFLIIVFIVLCLYFRFVELDQIILKFISKKLTWGVRLWFPIGVSDNKYMNMLLMFLMKNYYVAPELFLEHHHNKTYDYIYQQHLSDFALFYFWYDAMYTYTFLKWFPVNFILYVKLFWICFIGWEYFWFVLCIDCFYIYINFMANLIAVIKTIIKGVLNLLMLPILFEQGDYLLLLIDMFYASRFMHIFFIQDIVAIQKFSDLFLIGDGTLTYGITMVFMYILVIIEWARENHLIEILVFYFLAFYCLIEKPTKVIGALHLGVLAFCATVYYPFNKKIMLSYIDSYFNRAVYYRKISNYVLIKEYNLFSFFSYTIPLIGPLMFLFKKQKAWVPIEAFVLPFDDQYFRPWFRTSWYNPAKIFRRVQNYPHKKSYMVYNDALGESHPLITNLEYDNYFLGALKKDLLPYRIVPHESYFFNLSLMEFNLLKQYYEEILIKYNYWTRQQGMRFLVEFDCHYYNERLDALPKKQWYLWQYFFTEMRKSPQHIISDLIGVQRLLGLNRSAFPKNSFLDNKKMGIKNDLFYVEGQYAPHNIFLDPNVYNFFHYLYPLSPVKQSTISLLLNTSAYGLEPKLDLTSPLMYNLMVMGDFMDYRVYDKSYLADVPGSWFLFLKKGALSIGSDYFLFNFAHRLRNAPVNWFSTRKAWNDNMSDKLPGWLRCKIYSMCKKSEWFNIDSVSDWKLLGNTFVNYYRNYFWLPPFSLSSVNILRPFLRLREGDLKCVSEITFVLKQGDSNGFNVLNEAWSCGSRIAGLTQWYSLYNQELTPYIYYFGTLYVPLGVKRLDILYQPEIGFFRNMIRNKFKIRFEDLTDVKLSKPLGLFERVSYWEDARLQQEHLDFFVKSRNDAPHQGQIGFQDPATPTMEGLIDFHHELAFFMILISIFVFTFLFFIVFTFKNKNIRNYLQYKKPSLISHNTVLEIIWTIIPGMLLFAIAVPSFALLYAMDEVINPGVTLKAIGHQWYWSYEYGDPLPQFVNVIKNTVKVSSLMMDDDEKGLSDEYVGGISGLELDEHVDISSELVTSYKAATTFVPGEQRPTVFKNNHTFVYGNALHSGVNPIYVREGWGLGHEEFVRDCTPYFQMDYHPFFPTLAGADMVDFALRANSSLGNIITTVGPSVVPASLMVNASEERRATLSPKLIEAFNIFNEYMVASCIQKPAEVSRNLFLRFKREAYADIAEGRDRSLDAIVAENTLEVLAVLESWHKAAFTARERMERVVSSPGLLFFADSLALRTGVAMLAIRVAIREVFFLEKFRAGEIRPAKADTYAVELLLLVELLDAEETLDYPADLRRLCRSFFEFFANSDSIGSRILEGEDLNPYSRLGFAVDFGISIMFQSPGIEAIGYSDILGGLEQLAMRDNLGKNTLKITNNDNSLARLKFYTRKQEEQGFALYIIQRLQHQIYIDEKATRIIEALNGSLFVNGTPIKQGSQVFDPMEWGYLLDEMVELVTRAYKRREKAFLDRDNTRINNLLKFQELIASEVNFGPLKKFDYWLKTKYQSHESQGNALSSFVDVKGRFIRDNILETRFSSLLLYMKNCFFSLGLGSKNLDLQQTKNDILFKENFITTKKLPADVTTPARNAHYVGKMATSHFHPTVPETPFFDMLEILFQYRNPNRLFRREQFRNEEIRKTRLVKQRYMLAELAKLYGVKEFSYVNSNFIYANINILMQKHFKKIQLLGKSSWPRDFNRDRDSHYYAVPHDNFFFFDLGQDQKGLALEYKTVFLRDIWRKNRKLIARFKRANSCLFFHNHTGSLGNGIIAASDAYASDDDEDGYDITDDLNDYTLYNRDLPHTRAITWKDNSYLHKLDNIIHINSVANTGVLWQNMSSDGFSRWGDLILSLRARKYWRFQEYFVRMEIIRKYKKDCHRRWARFITRQAVYHNSSIKGLLENYVNLGVNQRLLSFYFEKKTSGVFTCFMKPWAKKKEELRYVGVSDKVYLRHHGIFSHFGSEAWQINYTKYVNIFTFFSDETPYTALDLSCRKYFEKPTDWYKPLKAFWLTTSNYIAENYVLRHFLSFKIKIKTNLLLKGFLWGYPALAWDYNINAGLTVKDTVKRSKYLFLLNTMEEFHSFMGFYIEGRLADNWSGEFRFFLEQATSKVLAESIKKDKNFMLPYSVLRFVRSAYPVRAKVSSAVFNNLVESIDSLYQTTSISGLQFLTIHKPDTVLPLVTAKIIGSNDFLAYKEAHRLEAFTGISWYLTTLEKLKEKEFFIKNTLRFVSAERRVFLLGKENLIVRQQTVTLLDKNYSKHLQYVKGILRETLSKLKNTFNTGLYYNILQFNAFDKQLEGKHPLNVLFFLPKNKGHNNLEKAIHYSDIVSLSKTFQCVSDNEFLGRELNSRYRNINNINNMQINLPEFLLKLSFPLKVLGRFIFSLRWNVVFIGNFFSFSYPVLSFRHAKADGTVGIFFEYERYPTDANGLINNFEFFFNAKNYHELYARWSYDGDWFPAHRDIRKFLKEKHIRTTRIKHALIEHQLLLDAEVEKKTLNVIKLYRPKVISYSIFSMSEQLELIKYSFNGFRQTIRLPLFIQSFFTGFSLWLFNNNNNFSKYKLSQQSFLLLGDIVVLPSLPLYLSLPEMLYITPVRNILFKLFYKELLLNTPDNVYVIKDNTFYEGSFEDQALGGKKRIAYEYTKFNSLRIKIIKMEGPAAKIIGNQLLIARELKNLGLLNEYVGVLNILDKKVAKVMAFYLNLGLTYGFDYATARYGLSQKELVGLYNTLQFNEVGLQMEIISRYALLTRAASTHAALIHVKKKSMSLPAFGEYRKELDGEKAFRKAAGYPDSFFVEMVSAKSECRLQDSKHLTYCLMDNEYKLKRRAYSSLFYTVFLSDLQQKGMARVIAKRLDFLVGGWLKTKDIVQRLPQMHNIPMFGFVCNQNGSLILTKSNKIVKPLLPLFKKWLHVRTFLAKRGRFYNHLTASLDKNMDINTNGYDIPNTKKIGKWQGAENKYKKALVMAEWRYMQFFIRRIMRNKPFKGLPVPVEDWFERGILFAMLKNDMSAPKIYGQYGVTRRLLHIRLVRRLEEQKKHLAALFASLNSYRERHVQLYAGDVSLKRRSYNQLAAAAEKYYDCDLQMTKSEWDLIEFSGRNWLLDQTVSGRSSLTAHLQFPMLIVSDTDETPVSFFQARQGELKRKAIQQDSQNVSLLNRTSTFYMMDDKKLVNYQATKATAVQAKGYNFVDRFYNLRTGNALIRFDSYMLPEEELALGMFRNLEVDQRIILPEKVHVRVLVTSDDVLHSWAIPALGVKMDACPGRLNQTEIFAKRTGVFYGQCSEICGINHGFMPIVVEIVHPNKYANWIYKQFLGKL